MNTTKALEELKLSQNEITVYLYLLSHGKAAASQIYLDSDMDKSACYKALAKLKSRDLVVSSGDSRNQTYKISSKDKLFDQFEKRVDEIEQSKNQLANAISDIEKYSVEHYQDENIQILTGKGAYGRYHKELIKGDVELIRTIASSETQLRIAGSEKELVETNDWFIPERLSKKIKIQVMYDINSIPDQYDISNLSKLKECRQYQSVLSLDSAMSTFGGRVGFTTIKNDGYWALILKDKLIVNLLNSMYDALWKQSEIL